MIAGGRTKPRQPLIQAYIRGRGLLPTVEEVNERLRRLELARRSGGIVNTLQMAVSGGAALAGPGTPADTVVTETAFGQAASAGGVSSYSRGTHTHGSPTDPVPAHAAAGDPHAPYELSPAIFDAIVDGVGTKPGHYAQITSAITAGAVHIAVLPKPSAGRYDAFTVAAGNACRSVQGIGPGILVAAVTIDKDQVLLRQLESNARVTLNAVGAALDRVACNDAAADAGFTIGITATDTILTACRVLGTTGIAFDCLSGAARITAIDFAVQGSSGVNLIRAADANGLTIIGLTLSDPTATLVTPSEDGIKFTNGVDATIITAHLLYLVPSGFRVITTAGTTITSLHLADLRQVYDDGTNPPIYIQGNAGGLVVIDGLKLYGAGAPAAVEVGNLSTSNTLITGVSAYPFAVATGAGKWRTKDNHAEPDRYDAFASPGDDGPQPASDGLAGVQVGTSALAWAQVWGHILGVKNYADLYRVAAPANPGANIGRLYVKQIDANNDGLFIKLKKAGVITETQIV